MLSNKLYQNDNIKINKCKNRLNLIYYANNKDIYAIFGDKFVKNNISNIKLIINGENSNLVKKYKLNKFENNIEIIINNKLTSLEDMFYNIYILKDIEELKYLDTEYINNLSYMFYGCTSLSDIKPLENWDVSNVSKFSYMFDGCTSLSDIKPLEKWNVSKVNNFSDMFNGCTSLNDIKSLKNWNVSNGNNFSDMFNGCISLSDISPLSD